MFSTFKTFETAPFNPLSINPLAWFDSSDSGTLFDATTGGNNVVADGAIARWEDKSGNGRHLTQATLGNRPLRKVSTLNDRDTILFNGTSNWFSSLNLPVNSALNVFIVFRPESKGAYHNVYDGSFMFWLNAANRLEQNANSTASSGTSDSVYIDTWITAASITGTTSPRDRVMVNGVNVSTDISTRGAFNATYTISWFNRGGAQTFKGSVAEIIVSGNRLDNSQIDSVNRYLALKWGIAMPNTEYAVQSTAPTAWYNDLARNSQFWYDVTGNGRNLSQATASSQPTIVTNSINGKAIRRYDGTNRFFYNSNIGVSALSDFTVVAVHKYNSVVSSGTGWEGIVYMGLDGTQTTTNTGQLHLQRINLTNQIGCHNAGVAPTSIGVDTGTGGLLVPRITAISRSGGTAGNGGTVSIRSNVLTSSGTQSWTTSAVTSPNSIQIGGRQQTIVPYTNADIAEVIIFNRAITTNERTNIFNFLSQKYAITV